jgi:hypothetical protein
MELFQVLITAKNYRTFFKKTSVKVTKQWRSSSVNHQNINFRSNKVGSNVDAIGKVICELILIFNILIDILLMMPPGIF